jgi:hypothetical protein
VRICQNACATLGRASKAEPGLLLGTGEEDWFATSFDSRGM